MPSVDGSGLYLLTASNAHTAHLARLDLESGREEVLAHDPDYDVATAVSHPVTRAPQIVAILRDRLELAALDRSLEDDLAMLHGADPGDLYGLQRDDADRRWLATFVADHGPARTYLYERDRGKISLLFKSRGDLDPYRLATMEPFGFRARDGLTIPGYLSFPPGQARRRLPGCCWSTEGRGVVTCGALTPPPSGWRTVAISASRSTFEGPPDTGAPSSTPATGSGWQDARRPA